LAHAVFPLGGSTKDDVRLEAERRGLSVARKPDSHDICFIADGDTSGWLQEKLGAAPGEIVDTAGQVLGSHEGSFGFTIGQRKGLRLGVPAADGKPRYVLDIEPVSGRVTVGDRDGLTIDHIVGIKPRWCGSVPTGELACTVQLRAHGEEFAAVARVVDEPFGPEEDEPFGPEEDEPFGPEESENGPTVEIALTEPATGVAPGQAAVIYAGSRVVGSATIARTGRRTPA